MLNMKSEYSDRVDTSDFHHDELMQDSDRWPCKTVVVLDIVGLTSTSFSEISTPFVAWETCSSPVATPRLSLQGRSKPARA